MSLSGRHSKACLHCRTRRIKCDRAVPACSQCLRSGRSCIGYRSHQALMFRDESSKVQEKVQSLIKPSDGGIAITSASRAILPPESASRQRFIAKDDPTFHAMTIVRKSPSPPGLDRGIEFFYDHYSSFVSDSPKGKGNLPNSEVWPLLFESVGFKNALSAAGYLGLSNRDRNSSLIVTARKSYSSSLQELTDTLSQGKPSDLALSFEWALMLAVFEIVNAGSWEVHMQGGAAIWKSMAEHVVEMESRPRQQLWFIFLYFIRCLLAGEPAPKGIEVWSKRILNVLSPDYSDAATLAYILSRFVDLYAAVENGSITNSLRVVQETDALNSELQEWETNLPYCWGYSIKTHRDETETAYLGAFHEYRNFWIARMLNNYRWGRILINQFLLIHLANIQASIDQLQAQRIKSIAIISRLATEVCCSTHSFLEPDIIESTQQVPYPVLGGCFLILFPLALVACATGIPEDQQNWAIAILQLIGNQRGVAAALRIIEPTLRKREEWKKYGNNHGARLV